MTVWVEKDKEYEVSEKIGYFDLVKYNKRTNYNWPGIKDDASLPPLTKDSDFIKMLKPGTVFKVIEILYQGIKYGKKYQAVEGEIKDIGKSGFIYPWHKDNRTFEEIPVTLEEIGHPITDDELKNGLKTKIKEELTVYFPAKIIRFPSGNYKISRFTLCSTDNEKYYKKTIKKNYDFNDPEKEYKLIFTGLLTDLSYTLEVDMEWYIEEDKKYEKLNNYEIFTNLPYIEIS